MGKLSTSYALKKLQNDSVVGILDVAGSIDSLNVKTFEAKAIEISNAGAQHLILNFQALEYMNSTGLGALVKILDHYEDRSGLLLIAHVNSRILDLFEMLGIAPVVKVFPTIEDAIVALPCPLEEEVSEAFENITFVEELPSLDMDEEFAEESNVIEKTNEEFDAELAETAMLITSPDDEALPADLFDSISSQRDLEDMMSSDFSESIAESTSTINKIETISNIDSDHFGDADSEMVVAMDTIDAIKAIQPTEKPSIPTRTIELDSENPKNIPVKTTDLDAVVPDKKETSPKEKKEENIKPQPKAKSKKQRKISSPISGETMEFPQGKRSQRRQVLRQESQKKTYKRKSHLRHYEVMNPMKSYPLSISFAKNSVKEIRLDSVQQVGGPDLEVSSSQPHVIVTPHLPGCVVNPASITLDITPEIATANFSVIPILEGQKNGTIHIAQENQVIKSMDFSFQIEKKTWAKVGAVAAIVSPFLSIAFDSLEWNTDKLLPGFFQYLQSNYGISFIIVGVVLTVLFSLVALFFHLQTKEKEAEEQELMLKWETCPSVGNF